MKFKATLFLVFASLLLAGNSHAQTPTVSTDPASFVSFNSAILNGTINANGTLVTTGFDFGTTTSYGISSPSYPSQFATSTPTQTSVTRSNLLPGTTYHFRAKATYGSGQVVYGSDQTFTTQPLAAPSITVTPVNDGPFTFVTFRATINPNNSEATWYVEFGQTTAYGTIANTSPAVLNGGSPLPVAKDVYGLQLNKTYHYRIVSSNYMGITYSPDYTFNTFSSSSIQNIASAGFHMYPNPAKDVLTIDAPINMSRMSIQVIDMYGRAVDISTSYRSAQYNLDISKLSAGTYWLSISDGEKKYVGAFTKQ